MRGTRRLAALATLSAWSSAAGAQTLPELKDAAEMMVSSASTCSAYLRKPDALSVMRTDWQGKLVAAGIAEAEALAFLDGVVASAQAEKVTETQSQVACEMINIRALRTE